MNAKREIIVTSALLTAMQEGAQSLINDAYDLERKSKEYTGDVLHAIQAGIENMRQNADILRGVIKRARGET